MNKKLYLIFCWHMHQPDYRDTITGEFHLPWTYLHALKDYTDMVYHLETHPKVHAVVNFVPILVDQLEDYASQFTQGPVRDPLLNLLQRPDMEGLTSEQRSFILSSCFAANHSTMVDPYPSYKRLYELYRQLSEHGKESLNYLSSQYMADLLVWYHLGWLGESVRRNSEMVAKLFAKGNQFSLDDRRDLFAHIGNLIQGLIPRYKELAGQGQIEISTTPHYHPIAPLLISFESAKESMPDVMLPEASGYCGGASRVNFHISSAIESHRARFGAAPNGMWPSEGGVSKECLTLFAQHGVGWAASGEWVLVNSLRKQYGEQPIPSRFQYLYRPYKLPGDAQSVSCFFRDDRLSDLIGFEYSKWYGRDAVNNFVYSLEEIWRNTPPDENPVVSVIMDGENAWEYFPYNGYYFLSELYDALESHTFIRTTTFNDYLKMCAAEPVKKETGTEVNPASISSLHGNAVQSNLDVNDIAKADLVVRHAEPGLLPQLVAGSWVYGNFSTWIGSPQKNRAWDLLCEAKQSFDLVISSARLSKEETALAYQQLADCEGSDWFWWFGDYNPAQSVSSFDKLFRANLANLYKLLKLPVPASLDEPISQGGGHAESSGTMRRSS